MKKIVLTALLGALAAGSVLAQGVVTFTASGTTRPVDYTTDGTTLIKFPVGSPSTAGTYGNLNVAMYSAAAGATLTTLSTPALMAGNAPDFSLNGWGIASPILNNIPVAAGGITASSITLTVGTPTAQVIIVGWTGNSTTFAQALVAAEAGQALIGWCGSLLSSTSQFSWLDTTGSALSPAANVVGTAGYNGLVLGGLVPEPGTLALGGLGAAALLLFRRRK